MIRNCRSVIVPPSQLVLFSRSSSVNLLIFILPSIILFSPDQQQLTCSSTVLNNRPATGLFSFLMGGGPTFPARTLSPDQKPSIKNDTNSSRNHSLAASSSSQLNQCSGSAPPILQQHRRASQKCQNDSANDDRHIHTNVAFGGAAKTAVLHADVPLNREFVETELIKSLIVSYFNIVR